MRRDQQPYKIFMNNTIEIILYIFGIILIPIIFVLPLLIKISKIKNAKNKIITLHLGKTKIITTKSSFLSLIFSVVLIFIMDNFVPIPFFLYLILIFVSIALGKNLQIIDKGEIITVDSNQIKSDLNETLSKIKISISAIEKLAFELESKNTEITEKGNHAKELDSSIASKLSEYETAKNLSDEEKKLIMDYQKSSNKKSLVSLLGIVIGSILLNLIANIIWAYFGNPDKTTLTESLMSLFGKGNH